MHVDWWTLGLQTINVLILVWILGRFFIRPVTAIVAKRQDEAKKVLADAETARRQVEATRAAADKARAEIDACRLELLDEARKEARVEKARLVEEASREAAKMRSAAAATAATHRAEAEDELLRHASELSLEIARRLLDRLPPETALAAFTDGLCREIRALPSESQAGLKPATPGDPLEVCTASDLTDAQKQFVRAGLADALGFEPAIAFRHDDALMAGLELRGSATIVRNNWRSDLDRIREELARGAGR
jgi:F-type H+-transporting ATPase subunit b